MSEQVTQAKNSLNLLQKSVNDALPKIAEAQKFIQERGALLGIPGGEGDKRVDEEALQEINEKIQLQANEIKKIYKVIEAEKQHND